MKFPFGKKAEENENTENYRNDGFFRGDEDEDEGVVDDFYGETKKEPEAPAASKPAAGTMGASSLKVVKPHGMADGQDVVDYLMQGYTVVMNIEELERAAAIRLVDFLMGALYVLGGELKRVTKTTLVLSPRSGELSMDENN